MKATVEPLEGNKVKLSVEVDEVEFDKAIDAAFRKIGREVKVPGFRPGKVPRKLLEARLGPGVAREEALRDSLPEYYSQALRDNEVDAIAAPEIDVTSGRDDGPIAFDAVVEVRPQIKLLGYEGLQVQVPRPEPTDEEVDQQIDRLRAQSGELVVVEREIRAGDFVTIDVRGEREGAAVAGATAEDYLYEVGSGGIPEELDSQLRGAKIGHIVGADVPAGDDQGPVSFRVLIKEVKERVLPEVTDDWAQEASEFDSVEALRTDLRDRIALVKRVQSALALRDESLRALAELVSDPLPEPLVVAEAERRLHELAHRLDAQGGTIAEYLDASGETEEALLASVREGAEQAVRVDLALRALADELATEATDDDVDAEVARSAERLKVSAAALHKQLDREAQMPAVRSGIRKTKALEWLVDHVDVVDDEGNSIDRSLLAPPVAETNDLVKEAAE